MIWGILVSCIHTGSLTSVGLVLLFIFIRTCRSIPNCLSARLQLLDLHSQLGGRAVVMVFIAFEFEEFLINATIPDDIDFGKVSDELLESLPSVLNHCGPFCL